MWNIQMKKTIIRKVGVGGFHAFICGMLAVVSCCDAFPGVRYVRIEDLFGGNDALVINQVAAYTCGDSANVAYGKTATGSAFDGGDGSCAGTATSRAPSVAVTAAPDCNAARGNTFCSSDVASYWWQVDLGAAYDICSVAILQSSTGTGAKYVRFRNSAGTQIMSATLTDDFATLTTCSATACTVAARTCSTCTQATCNNQASNPSGSYPVCNCNCNAAYSGTYCETSIACTNSVDCNNRASTVTGNRPTCSCSCTAAWTGPSCQTSNVCTNSPDCSNRATTVSGNRPSCTCTCSAGWAGADCSLRVCAIGPDCNTTGTKAAGGTYPKCVCTCKLHFGGLTCARPLTASVSPSNDVTSSKSISHDATPSDSATSTNELSSAHTASSSPPTHTKSTSPTISRTPTMTRTATHSPSQTNSPTKTSSQISRNTSRTFSLTASMSLFGESWTGSNWSESLSIPFSSETSASATATGGFFSLSSTMLRSATLAHARSSTTSITESCAFPQLPPRLAPAAELVGGCTAHLPPTWTARVSSCIVGSSRIESDSSAVTFSRTALSYPYLLILPMVQQRQWRYSCPRPTAAESEEDVTCSVTQDDEKMVLLTLLMTTPVASVILECGTLSINVSWTVVWAEPMSAAVEVAAAIAAGGALLSGSGSAAAAMALVSLMSCSGKAPALASLGYVVSVFFELGFSGMAVGNIGLIVGLHLVHFSCVAAWKFVRRSPSLALASSDMRFPALSLLIACWLLPGSVYGAVAAITGNDDAAIGAVVLGLAGISIGISQFLLHHEVLPHASYVPHDRSLLCRGTRFPVLWWLIPESQWSPPMVVRRYHPLLTSRCRAHCWTAVMDTLLTCLLSVVAALGVGGDLSSCRAALIAVALLFFVYGIALAVLRAHRLPMDRLVFPFIQWGYGVLCVLKLFDVAQGTGEAIQLVVSVLQMWQVGWSFWVFFVERSLAAAACGSAGDDDGSSANSEELTKLQCGPQLSDVWLDSTHARTVLHVDAEAPLFSFFPPLSEIADDEAKFWSPDGLAVLHERGSHDSPLLMQRSVSLADSSMLDEILESIGREG